MDSKLYQRVSDSDLKELKDFSEDAVKRVKELFTYLDQNYPIKFLNAIDVKNFLYMLDSEIKKEMKDLR